METDTAFFAFADTVVAQNYRGTNHCHGWLGIRFQSRPHDEDNQIVLHLIMKDGEKHLAAGSTRHRGCQSRLRRLFPIQRTRTGLLESLLDGLTTDRIEIDMIDFSGIEFRQLDKRVMSLRLVQMGLSKAAMFGPDGEVIQPADALRKKPVLVERGSFRPVCHVNLDMIRSARETFSAADDVNEKDVVEIMEITMNNLQVDGDIDLRDFLARVDLLGAVGKTVLISDYYEYFRLGEYLRAIHDRACGHHDGWDEPAGDLRRTTLFDARRRDPRIIWSALQETILGSTSIPISTPQRVNSSPLGISRSRKNCGISFGIWSFAAESSRSRMSTKKCLHIFSRDILKKIGSGDPSWEANVPESVAALIKERGYFHYQE